MASYRKAKFSQTPTITWTDGSNFDGFILVGLVPPTSGTDWSSIAVGAGAMGSPQRVPVFALVKIQAGKYDQNASLIFNADLQPPNTQYVAWIYDNTRISGNTSPRQIAGPSTKFTVSADPFTPPSLTLTAPTAGTTNPTPDS